MAAPTDEVFFMEPSTAGERALEPEELAAARVFYALSLSRSVVATLPGAGPKGRQTS
jgi:hypothetical protein